MGAPKKKSSSTNLGKALINNRFKTQHNVNGSRMKVNPDGSMVKHTTEDEKNWAKMQSITQENDLDAFLSSATLAGTEFTAEKLNIQIIPKGYKNPFLLDATEEAETLARHQENKDSLTVPRRPVWDGVAKPEEQQRREREGFLAWRRSLVILEEEKGLLMTPYERNIEVWRQLWRVIERSDVVVQIVDARNPLMFRSPDLESYVKEVDKRKKNFLMVNKADMLTVPQRKAWADFFEAEGIQYMFFSAALAKKRKIEEDEAEMLRMAEMEESRTEQLVAEEMRSLGLDAPRLKTQKKNFFDRENLLNMGDDEDDDLEEELEDGAAGEEERQPTQDDDQEEEEEEEEEEGDEEEEEVGAGENSEFEDTQSLDEEPGQQESYGMVMSNAWKKGKIEEGEDEERIRILTCEQLLDRIMKECPTPLRPTDKKVTIGFVGYPNVGKSSTMNALVGSTKVTVSSTPGKTKHFQTIHLSDEIILCDCPGLVFPTFATTKAEMVVQGILPIDQLREHTGPATLVALRIPRHALEIIYGIDIRTFDEEGRPDPTKVPTGEDLCQAYAVARGFKKSSQGNPDEARAARFLLKDYVRGKLLYCLPPPNHEPTEFNAETYSGPEYRRQAKRGPQTHETAGDDGTLSSGSKPGINNDMEGEGHIDSSFFSAKTSGARVNGIFASRPEFTRAQMFPHQVGAKASAGAQVVGGRKGKGRIDGVVMAPAGMGAGLDAAVSKKHKKGKRAKVRTNWTADNRNE
ncbi:hypothetical protein HDU67_006486 [Dinochytrium kinnereticum]|nr:hypothetical protein HDU67_006486 [Dinochytrium kinnereticum]